MMRVAPRAMLGRVTSVFQPMQTVATLIGAALGGYLDIHVLRGISLNVTGIFGPLVLCEPPIPVEV